MMGDDDSGYDAFFVGDLQDAYKCAVCHLALRKPVQVIECGHRFCECCFVKMKNYSESRDVDFCCPLDRLAIDPIKVFRDKGIERTVLDLHVKCSNFQKGCNWVQELMQLQRHLQSCPHEMVKCGNTECSKLVERCELSQHEKHCPILQQKISHSVHNLGAVVKKLSERVDACESQLTTKDDRLGMYENVLSENNKRIAFLEKKLADNAKNDRLEKNEFLGKIKQLEDRLRKIECLPKVAAIASSSNSPQIEAKAVDKKTTSSSMLGYQKVEEPRFKAFGAKDSANNNYMLSAFGDKPAEVVKKKPEVPKLPEKPQEDETKKAKIIHNYQSVQQNQVPMMQGQIQSQPVYIQNGQNPQIRMNMNGPRMAQFATAQPFVPGGYQQNQQQGYGYQVQQPYGGQQQFQYLGYPPRGQYQQVYMVPQGGYPSNVVMQQQMPASQGQHIPGTRSFNQISATQLQPKKKRVIVLKDPTTGKDVTSEILKKKTERTTPSSGYSSTSSTPPLPQDDKKAKIQAAFAAQNQQQGYGYQVQQPYGGQQQFQYLGYPPRGQYQQVYMVPQGEYPSNVVMQQQMPASQGQHIPETRSFNQISATQLQLQHPIQTSQQEQPAQPKKRPVIVLKDPTTGKNVTSEILKKKTERTTPSSGYSSTSSTPPLPQDDKKAKIQAAFAAQVAAVQSSFKSPQIESKAVDNR